MPSLLRISIMATEDDDFKKIIDLASDLGGLDKLIAKAQILIRIKNL